MTKIIFSFLLVFAAGLLAYATSQWMVTTHKASDVEQISKNMELVPKERVTQTIQLNENTSVLSRTPHLTKYPCMACHTQTPPVEKKEYHRLTHNDIVIEHAKTFKMDCKLCHLEGQPDKLKLLTGETTTFNRADKLCQQCHSPQAKDWLGGAHGKRANSWHSKNRVIYACTTCHNPHKPGFEKRWPLLTPKIPRQNEVNLK